MAANIGASLNVVMPTCDAVGASSQLSFTVYRPATLTMSVPVMATDAAAVSPADSSAVAPANASAAPSATSGATNTNKRITLMETSLNRSCPLTSRQPSCCLCGLACRSR